MLISYICVVRLKVIVLLDRGFQGFKVAQVVLCYCTHLTCAYTLCLYQGTIVRASTHKLLLIFYSDEIVRGHKMDPEDYNEQMSNAVVVHRKTSSQMYFA